MTGRTLLYSAVAVCVYCIITGKKHVRHGDKPRIDLTAVACISIAEQYGREENLFNRSADITLEDKRLLE